ncbi:hypothetical protein Dimus_013016 [Dionaea muscipula]
MRCCRQRYCPYSALGRAPHLLPAVSRLAARSTARGGAPLAARSAGRALYWPHATLLVTGVSAGWSRVSLPAMFTGRTPTPLLAKACCPLLVKKVVVARCLGCLRLVSLAAASTTRKVEGLHCPRASRCSPSPCCSPTPCCSLECSCSPIAAARWSAAARIGFPCYVRPISWPLLLLEDLLNCCSLASCKQAGGGTLLGRSMHADSSMAA